MADPIRHAPDIAVVYDRMLTPRTVHAAVCGAKHPILADREEDITCPTCLEECRVELTPPTRRGDR